MGGAVSSGRDNNELIDNLMGGNYIRSRDVEKVFRALDRADYMTPEARDQAYKDLAWRNGPLHMSAPCIYSEVMEGLELKPGLSFLNVGSGTGYLSTLVGLILGSAGISHGIEIHQLVVEYANKKLSQFLENSPTLDEFDFCEPKYYCGNGLCLAPLLAPYDRVYCGAGCPEQYQNYFQQLIKVGGILVMPLNDNLLQVKRISATEWTTRNLLNVSFATLRVPTKEESQDLLRLEEQSPSRLQVLARAVIRERMRAALRRRHPQLREPPPRAPPAKKACPRRICIPVDDDSDNEGFNALHDLDRASGANEMNALLSLVLSMGHNRVAGALRVDPLDSPTDSSSDELGGDEHNDNNDDDDDNGGGDRPDNDSAPVLLSSAGTEPNRDLQSGPEGERRERAPQVATERPTFRRDVMERGARNLELVNQRPTFGRDIIERGERLLQAVSERPTVRRRANERERRPGPARPSARRRVLERVVREYRVAADRPIGRGVLERCERDHGSGAPEYGEEDQPQAVGRSVIMFEIREGVPGPAPPRASGSDKHTDTSKESESDSLGKESTSKDSESTPKDDKKEKKATTSKDSSLEDSKKRSGKKASRRPSTGSRRSSKENKDCEQENPEVPAEVEIYLAKSRDAPGTSTMEWEPSETKAETSDEETETSTSKTKEEKRQKLDSGIGEGNTPESSSHTTKSDESDESRRSNSITDEGCDDDRKGRKRRQKRGHLSTRSSSSTEGEDSSPEDAASAPLDIEAMHAARRRRRLRESGDARRVQLSVLMKRGVKELPLPYALKKYVNLGRCFEF